MCLILLAWKVHARAPLVVAANREEFHARAAAPATFWQDQPAILAGRDLQAGGTWLGLSRGGRFASVTNYRGGHDPKAAESRGALVTRFLLDGAPPRDYVAGVKPAAYSGFNLLLADGNELWWLSNRAGDARRLDPGYYALGNLLLDTPEVWEIRNRFASTPLAIEPMFSLLATAKVIAPVYGTRCSTVVIAGSDGRLQFAERNFGAAGTDGSTSRYEFARAA